MIALFTARDFAGITVKPHPKPQEESGDQRFLPPSPIMVPHNCSCILVELRQLVLADHVGINQRVIARGKLRSAPIPFRCQLDFLFAPICLGHKGENRASHIFMQAAAHALNLCATHVRIQSHRDLGRRLRTLLQQTPGGSQRPGNLFPRATHTLPIGVQECRLKARFQIEAISPTQYKPCMPKLMCFAVCVVLLAWSAVASTNHHVILITIDGFPAYLLDDPQAPIPILRRFAREGAAAEGMKVSNPSVTWPNHTTLVTGVNPERHSVFFNGVLVRPGAGMPVRVDGQRDKKDLVQVPTIFDVLHRAGYRTAGINWPCTRNSGTLDDDFPDVPNQINYTTPRLRDELIASGTLRDNTQQSFASQSAASKDQIWTAAATHVIRTRTPNFMLLHMLITDSTHHRYGAQSLAGYTAVALADAQLRDVWQAVKDAGIESRTTILIVADHGFEKALKLMNPNVIFRKAGLLETASTPTGIVRARAQIISEGGIAMVYLTNPETYDADAAKVRASMKEQEGIAEILGPDSFAALGLPDPKKNLQMADLILAAKPGYAFNNNAQGDDFITEVTLAAGNQGHHGYLSTNPKMNAVFVAWGRGIKSGARLGLVQNMDVAPTIAHLLGVELPGVQGKPLMGVLAKP